MRLDDFDWSRLTHVYGSAEDVPDLVADLLDGDEGTVDEVLEELVSALVHQGDATSATAATVLVLIGTLREGCDHAAAVLELLAVVASVAAESGPVTVEEARDARARLLAGDVDAMTVNSTSARAAVWAALDDLAATLPPHLDWASPGCGWAIECVAALGERASTLRPRMLDLVASNPEPGEQRVLEPLARLSARGEHLELYRAYLGHEDVRARADAALALVIAGDTSDATLDTLASAATGPAIPPSLEDMAGVGALLEDEAPRFFDRVLRRASGFHVSMDALLAWLDALAITPSGGTRATHDSLEFGGPARDVPRDAKLIALVDACVHARGLWNGRTNVFEMLGLPGSREELAAWLRHPA
ncbi:MAG: hypothetical protein H6724_10310 [Sandaracinus sp.]|nr:hypothetical protein [Sandaracinus sp.]